MHRSQASFIPEIDALRCFAMSAVVLLHVGLFPIGWAGVWLFFVISGFVITRSIQSTVAYQGFRIDALITFFIKRARRILPLYFLYLALMLVLSATIFTNANLQRALPYLATFTYNIASIFDPTLLQAPAIAHLWSLSIEEQFYLLFPLAFLFLSRRNFVVLLFFVIAFSPIVRIGWGMWLQSLGMTPKAAAAGIYTFTFCHFDAFAAGALLALSAQQQAISRRVAAVSWVIIAIATVAYVGIYAWIGWTDSKQIGIHLFRNLISGEVIGDGREAFQFSLVTGASVALILSILAGSPWIIWICRPLAFRYVGKISYGAYVYHALMTGMWLRLFPDLHALGLPGKLALFVLGYGSTILVAALSYHLLEQQFLAARTPVPSRKLEKNV